MEKEVGYIPVDGGKMTIRQIADTAGCAMNTVRKIGKMLYPDVKAIGRGLPIEYDKKQSIKIMGKLPKKEFISDPTKIGNPDPTKIGNPVGVDYEAIGQMIGIAVTQALAPVIERLSAMPEEKTPAMIAAPEQDRRSMLNQIVNKYALEKTGGDRREAWGVLYEELYYRCKVSVRTRANNSGRSKIEEIELAGLLESSYLIMIEKLGE